MHIESVEEPSDEGRWTDYLAGKGAKRNINRQCSIGWHLDCSSPSGEDCECHCHPHSDFLNVERS